MIKYIQVAGFALAEFSKMNAACNTIEKHRTSYSGKASGVMALLWTSLPVSRLLADVSLWSAKLAEPGLEVKKMEQYADLFHLDVSDAHFVSGLLFFPDLVAALRPLTQVPFHVHLMVERPADLVDAFVDAGANMITVHHENGYEAVTALEKIHQRGLAAGLALGQDLAPEGIIEYLEYIQLVLLMGTRLGVKGQSLNPETYKRIQTTRRILQEHGYTDRIKVGVDGGIREQTVPLLRAAGADLIVPGSLVFQSSDLPKTFAWLHALQVNEAL